MDPSNCRHRNFCGFALLRDKGSALTPTGMAAIHIHGRPELRREKGK